MCLVQHWNGLLLGGWGRAFACLALLLCQTEATTMDGVIAQLEWLKEDIGYHIADMVGAPYNRALNVLQSGINRAMEVA
jgi:hypothetical protein